MQADAEARDARAVAGHLSEEFIGPQGMGRDDFRRMLAVVWLRDKAAGAAVGPLDVEVTGDHARVAFTLAGRGGEGWMPDRAQVYRVRSAWRLERGEWRLLSAEWEPTL